MKFLDGFMSFRKSSPPSPSASPNSSSTTTLTKMSSQTVRTEAHELTRPSSSTTVVNNLTPSSTHQSPPIQSTQQQALACSRKSKKNQITLDSIIKGETCPPASAEDFMKYLMEVGQAPETFQFLLCVKDYTQRFNAADKRIRAQAPEFTPEMQRAARFKLQHSITARVAGTVSNPETVPWAERDEDDIFNGRTEGELPSLERAKAIVGSNLPFRDDAAMILHTYCLPNSPRALNIDGRERTLLETAVSITTHPSIFDSYLSKARTTLIHEKLPRFIQFSRANANPERQLFAKMLGVFTILLGLAVALTLTFTSWSVHYRWLASFFLILGLSTLWLACRGMCILLHGLGHYQLAPWELYDEADVEVPKVNVLTDFFSAPIRQEDKAWVRRHASVSWIRKVFGKERPVLDHQISDLQRREFIWSLIFAVTLGAFCTMLFVVFPNEGRRNYYN